MAVAGASCWGRSTSAAGGATGRWALVIVRWGHKLARTVRDLDFVPLTPVAAQMLQQRGLVNHGGGERMERTPIANLEAPLPAAF